MRYRLVKADVGFLGDVEASIVMPPCCSNDSSEGETSVIFGHPQTSYLRYVSEGYASFEGTAPANDDVIEFCKAKGWYGSGYRVLRRR